MQSGKGTARTNTGRGGRFQDSSYAMANLLSLGLMHIIRSSPSLTHCGEIAPVTSQRSSDELTVKILMRNKNFAFVRETIFMEIL